MSPSKVAIIPARGGSKRIPRKNIKEFHGKPMIAYSIEAAMASGCFDRVVVSTDDQDIANVAKQYGADVPFIRPAKISDDFATTLDVMEHAILELESHHFQVDFVCCIYATAPFVRPLDIQSGLTLMESGVDYAFSATSFPFPIQRALKKNAKDEVSMFFPEYLETRSQDLEEGYHDAGQFYWGTRDAFVAQRPIFSSKSRMVVLPRFRVQDIDTPEDWLQAEFLFSALENK
jgi:N-acylneuraminate cytidylyltransferase